MTISTVSSYQQLQNWSVSLTNAGRSLLGNNAGGANADIGSQLGDVASSFYSTQATLAAQGALSRVERQAYAAANKSPGGGAAVETALSAAPPPGDLLAAA